MSNLVEVTAMFLEPGDLITDNDRVHDALFGDSWSMSVEDFTLEDEENSCEDEEVLRFTRPAIGLSFVIIGTDPGEFSGPLDALFSENGNHIFMEWYSPLVEIAKEKREKLYLEEAQKGKAARQHTIRFITVWSYSAWCSYDGEWDSLMKLTGVLDVGHLHIEGESNEQERKRAFRKRADRKTGLYPHSF